MGWRSLWCVWATVHGWVVAIATPSHPTSAPWTDDDEMRSRPGLTVAGCEGWVGEECVLRCTLNPYGRHLGPQESVTWWGPISQRPGAEDAKWQHATVPITLGKATVRSTRSVDGRHFSQLRIPDLRPEDAGRYTCYYRPSELSDEAYLRVNKRAASPLNVSEEIGDTEDALGDTEGAGDGPLEEQSPITESILPWSILSWTADPNDWSSADPPTADDQAISPLVLGGFILTAISSVALIAFSAWMLWRRHRPYLSAYRPLR